jgi:carboxylesterase
MRLLPECTTRLLSHGEKTLNAVVFFHGYTSCPAEFAQLAELVFGEGRNVLVVPMPLHGLPDRMTEEHSKLRVDMLVAYADSVIDVAQGLGYSVSVAGLSAGGLLAAWAAQNRADVAQAMLISPVIGYEVVPPALTLAAGRLFALLPDRFVWWNPGKREALGPGYAYPRYSHHALAQLLVLGEAVLRDARTNGPATNELIVVTNGNDHDVSAHRIRQLVDAWRKAARARVRTYEFAADLGLGHSLIEPSEPGQRPDLVYPKLLELFRW